jgi:hypothetical protein
MDSARYVLVAALAVAAVAQGGFPPAAQRLVTVLVGVALAVAALVHIAPMRGGAVGSGLRRVVVAGGALAGWAVLDGALHGDAAAGAAPALLVAGVVGVLLAARRLDPPAGAPGGGVLGTGLLGVGLLVAATGWAGVALHRQPWGLPGQGGWRAASTLTYPNATAAVLVPLVLLALSRLAAERRPDARAGLAMTATALLAGLGATGSRAGLLSLLAGGAVLVAAAGPRRAGLGRSSPAVPGAVVVLAGLLPSVPEDGPARPLPAVLTLVAGLALAAWLAGRPAWVSGVLAAAGGAALIAAAVATPGLAGRLTVSSPDRVGALRAALRLVGGSPLTGTGPGGADLRWTDDAGVHVIGYAHDEYVQVAAELGLLGAALLVALLGALAAAVRRRPVGAAVLVAAAVAAAFDFGWHVPAVPLVAAAVLGLAGAGTGRAVPVPTVPAVPVPAVPVPAVTVPVVRDGGGGRWGAPVGPAA